MPGSDEERRPLRFNLQAERRPHELLEQSFLKSISIYLGVLGGTLGASIVVFKRTGVHPIQTALVLLGVVYLFAGIGWPRPLYLALRGMRPFYKVDDPRVLRWLMIVLGVLLIAGGIALWFFGFASGTWV